MIDQIGKISNLIVARTFSKAYGLAGLRLGLLAGCESLLKWLRRVLSPYSVNLVALAALTAALKDEAFLAHYVAEVKQARSEFLVGLTRLGLKYWPTEANFVLVNIGARHREFVTALRAHNILTRDRSADPGCQGLVRITIGTPSQMQHALQAIEAYLSQKSVHP